MRTLNKIKIAFLALVIMVEIPFSAYAVDGQRKISQTPSTTFPIVINQPGSYVLTSNLAVTDPNLNAIEIAVNDVTLDLNGHTIQGPGIGTGGGIGSGIDASNRYSITIKNGTVREFRRYGVILSSALEDPSIKGAGHQIKGIQITKNGTGGIFVVGTLVSDCVVNDNTGSGGITARNSVVTNCTTNNNMPTGITVWSSVVTNCTVNYNSDQGIRANHKCRIEGNNIRDNGGWGLNMGSDNNYAIKNTASGHYGNFIAGSNDYMPIWPAGGDNANYEFIPSDQGDWCEINSHPISLSFMYTGGGCAASNNAQNSSSCSGNIDSLQPISVTTSNTGYQINPTTVRPGEGFVVTNSGNRLVSTSYFTLTNQGGTEQLEIHTSCSQPLVQGDVFGSLTLINYTGE